MTDLARCLAAGLLGLLSLVLPVSIAWADELVIGHLEMKGDRDYRKSRTFAAFLTQPLGRPHAGGEVALGEVKWHGAATGTTFALDRQRARGDALVATAEAMLARGIRFIILDLPAAEIVAVSRAMAGREVVLFNVRAAADSLRGTDCRSNLLHIAPSDAMRADAVGQFLALRRWREVLVLVGPLAADKAMADAFRRTAARYGLKIADERDFVLSNDPRQRELNNPLLLTQGSDHDVIFVADSDGEFARDLNYRTVDPRPLVGSEGLAGLAWHWSWSRHGAPQLENRFQDHAGRPMRDPDWAAWLAVKAVATAVQRTGSVDFATLRDHLLSAELVLDGFKGNRLSFRPWDNQLRQPMLLATHNHVVARAPVEGFLHRTNNLDTLGVDEPETACRMQH
ncbi:MAG: ABC transporter substrate-binding protein [Minwuia thermotolerans]|nr:MAG: ABC transporter substrate-binding protein [Minwuia thermotolerans]